MIDLYDPDADLLPEIAQEARDRSQWPAGMVKAFRVPETCFGVPECPTTNEVRR